MQWLTGLSLLMNQRSPHADALCALCRGLRLLLRRWEGRGFERDLRQLYTLLESGSALRAQSQVGHHCQHWYRAWCSHCLLCVSTLSRAWCSHCLWPFFCVSQHWSRAWCSHCLWPFFCVCQHCPEHGAATVFCVCQHCPEHGAATVFCVCQHCPEHGAATVFCVCQHCPEHGAATVFCVNTVQSMVQPLSFVCVNTV